MHKIIIVASELSIITGHNKYEPIKKAVDSVLNRSKIVKKHIPKTKIEESLITLSEKDLKCIKKELKIDSESSLKDVEIMIKKQVLNKSLDGNISEDQSKKKVDDKYFKLSESGNFNMINKDDNAQIRDNLNTVGPIVE